MKLNLPPSVSIVDTSAPDDIDEEIKEYITDNKPAPENPLRNSINRPKIMPDTPQFLHSRKLFGRLDIILSLIHI